MHSDRTTVRACKHALIHPHWTYRDVQILDISALKINTNGLVNCIQYWLQEPQQIFFNHHTISLDLFFFFLNHFEQKLLHLQSYCPLNLISLLVLALISSTTLILAFAHNVSNYGGKKIAVWAAAEAYKPIRWGIKQSESCRVMPPLLLIFPNIYSENCVRICLKQLRWNCCSILLYDGDVTKKKKKLHYW